MPGDHHPGAAGYAGSKLAYDSDYDRLKAEFVVMRRKMAAMQAALDGTATDLSRNISEVTERLPASGGPIQTTPSGPAGGDIAGYFPDELIVQRIQQVAVSDSAPADGQVLVYDEATFQYAPEGVVQVKKASAEVGKRRGVNFIDGADVTHTVADNSGSDQVDVTGALTDTGVTADTYGDASHIPVLQVNAKGRVVAASEIAVSSDDHKVMSSAADVTPGYLYDEVTVTAPLTKTLNNPGANENVGLAIPKATAAVDGYLDKADFATFNGKQAAGSYITALTGDGAAAGPGSAAFTLASVGSAVTKGSASKTVTATSDVKGRITSLTDQDIAIAGSQIASGTVDQARLPKRVVTISLVQGGFIPTTGIDIDGMRYMPYGLGGASITWALVRVTMYVQVPNAGNDTINIVKGASGDNTFGAGTSLITSNQTRSGATHFQKEVTSGFAAQTVASGVPIAVNFVAWASGEIGTLECTFEEQ
jgi:hypothetical protein